MKRLVALLVVIGLVPVGIALSADEPTVEHVTVLAGEDLAAVAARKCPQNPAAAEADLATNAGGAAPGRVLHYHPGACTGETTTLPTTTTSAPSTTTPATTSTVATTSTTSTTTAPSTTSSSSTTTTPPATTSSTTTSSTTTTTSTTSTSTTVPAPTTTGGSGTQAFTASFATASDFYGRFWTYVGNYCDPSYPPDCRPEDFSFGLDSFSGDHNTACEGPTTQRTVEISNHANLFWWCAPNGPDTGHVMVANSLTGYGITGIAPAQSFTNIRRICWDQNLSDLGGGKWMVISIVPAAVFTSHPNLNPDRGDEGEGPWRLDYTLPEFDADNNPGDFNLQRQSRWQFKLFRNQLRIFDSISGSTGADWGTDGGFIAGHDLSTRYKMCLTETATGMTVSQARPGTTATWTANGARFPDGPVYVIWGDDTYDDPKREGDLHKTWHFDNILIETA